MMRQLAGYCLVALGFGLFVVLFLVSTASPALPLGAFIFAGLAAGVPLIIIGARLASQVPLTTPAKPDAKHQQFMADNTNLAGLLLAIGLPALALSTALVGLRPLLITQPVWVVPSVIMLWAIVFGGFRRWTVLPMARWYAGHLQRGSWLNHSKSRS
jgi:hypothetical protein